MERNGFFGFALAGLMAIFTFEWLHNAFSAGGRFKLR